MCPRPQPHAAPSPSAPSPCPVSDGQLVAPPVSPALSAPPCAILLSPPAAHGARGRQVSCTRQVSRLVHAQSGQGRAQHHAPSSTALRAEPPAPCRPRRGASARLGAPARPPGPPGGAHGDGAGQGEPRWGRHRGLERAGGDVASGGGCKSEQFKPLTLIVTKMRKQETLPAESKAVKRPLLSHRDLSEVFPGDACPGAAPSGCRGQAVHGPFVFAPRSCPLRRAIQPHAAAQTFSLRVSSIRLFYFFLIGFFVSYSFIDLLHGKRLWSPRPAARLLGQGLVAHCSGSRALRGGKRKEISCSLLSPSASRLGDEPQWAWDRQQPLRRVSRPGRAPSPCFPSGLRGAERAPAVNV